MTVLTASIRRNAARSTLELPFFIPAKEWFTLEECATLSGMSVRYVEKKFDEGTELSGHVHNGGKGERNTKRVPRVWFVAWMTKTAQHENGTAIYDNESLGDAVIQCLRYLSRDVLLKIAAAATRFADQKAPGARG